MRTNVRANTISLNRPRHVAVDGLRVDSVHFDRVGSSSLALASAQEGGGLALFWAQFDFNPQGIGVQQRDSTIAHLREAWEFNDIEIPLPACG